MNYLDLIINSVNEQLRKVPLHFDPTRSREPRPPRIKPERAPPDAIQVAVNKLTNWQRSKWAQAGYPKSEKKLAAFAELEHWKHK